MFRRHKSERGANPVKFALIMPFLKRHWFLRSKDHNQPRLLAKLTAARRLPIWPKTRLEGERGAALVEAAFVTTLLVMLLLGTVTAALAYGQYTSLQTAAREASRFGASLPVNGDLNGWLDEVLDVAKAAGNLDLLGSVPGQYICIAYVYPDGGSANDQTKRLVESLGVTGAYTAGSTCFSDGRPNDERRVQVVTGRTSTIQAVMFKVDVNLSTPAAARFERGA